MKKASYSLAAVGLLVLLASFVMAAEDSDRAKKNRVPYAPTRLQWADVWLNSKYKVSEARVTMSYRVDYRENKIVI